jgi:hypothetical protein
MALLLAATCILTEPLQFLECIEPVVRYVEAQFERTQSIVASGEGDLMSLLSGAGTPAVDIVFYVVLHSLSPHLALWP